MEFKTQTNYRMMWRWILKLVYKFWYFILPNPSSWSQKNNQISIKWNSSASAFEVDIRNISMFTCRGKLYLCLWISAINAEDIFNWWPVPRCKWIKNRITKIWSETLKHSNICLFNSRTTHNKIKLPRSKIVYIRERSK